VNQHGRRYEHELVNGLHRLTDGQLWVTSVGYSGNAATDDCDVVVVLDPYLCTSHEDTMYCIEAKKRKADSEKRFTAFSGSSGDETGLDELHRIVDGTPSWGKALVVLKVTRRKVFVLDVGRLIRVLEGEEKPTNGELSVLQPRLTPSDSVSMVKPSTDDWDSAQVAPDDAVVVARHLGVAVDE
jgi:hypothetical protein